MSKIQEIKLPKIIFGTSALGNLYTEQPDAVKEQIVSECFNHSDGPVVFDSAGKYGAGLALEELGRILAKLNIHPDQVIISNKLGWLRTPLTTAEPTFEPGVWQNLKYDAIQRISYNGILDCFEQGNQLLGNYKPGFVSVHDPDEYLAKANNALEYYHLLDEIVDAYRALAKLKNEGKVQAIGIGAKDWKVIKTLYSQVSFDWVMFANSMTIMNHPEELIDFMVKLRDNGVTIINSAVFQAGFLIGGEFYDYRKIEPDTHENKQKFEWRNRFHRLCDKHSITPMLACVNFALNAPGVSSVSLNTSKPGHVATNIASVNNPVPAAFYDEMKKEGLIKSYCNFI